MARGDTNSVPPDAAEWKAPKIKSQEEFLADIEKDKSVRESRLFASGWERIWDEDTGQNVPGAPSVRRPNTPKTWNRNGYTIAAVDSNRRTFARPHEDEVVAELRALGYNQDEGIGVPYSNDPPKHPDVKARWQKLWDARNARERAKLRDQEN